MTGDEKTQHYTSEQLAAWVHREMADDEVPGLELHLATCDECALLARAEYDLSSLSGRSSASAHAAARIAEAARKGLLSVAERMPAGAAERLAAWVQGGMDHLSGLLRVVRGRVMNMPGIGSGVFSELAPVFRGAVARKLAVIHANKPGPHDRGRAEVYELDGGLLVRFPAVLREEAPPRPFLLVLDNPAAAVELALEWSEQVNMWCGSVPEPPQDCCIIIAPPLDSAQ